MMSHWGANCTIVCGHEVGHHATIAAEAVVATNIPSHTLMAGVPSKWIGWACEYGQVRNQRKDGALTYPDYKKKYNIFDDAIIE